jgi:glycosyltransferase involved in cell wall biosynthesis
MKILLFTPILATSAIGRVSRLVVSALLHQGHEVVVARTEAIDLHTEKIHAFPCKVINWNDFKTLQQSIDDASLVVYQVGNNLPFHLGCLEWLSKVPGLVCLHDNFLGHLFWGWSDVIGRDKALSILAGTYSAETSHRFFDHGDSTSFINYASQMAPMTEWISSMASAVIVHSSWAMDRIAPFCNGPVEVVALPYDAPHIDIPTSSNQQKNTSQITALTIGHVNPNKRYAQVIEAIGSSPILRERLCFRIVGQIEASTKQELHSLAENLGVSIATTGAVDDNQLAAEIHASDIMCCLRWPALESASASTIEAMLYAKPTIVTNTGFYKDLPADCVCKISPETEIADLRTHLEKLVSSPQLREALSVAAREYARKTFQSDNYALRLVNMKHKIDQSKIVSSVALVFSTKLKAWGALKNDVIVEAVAAPLSIFQ